ncbi:MAG: hypothetical protein JWP04_357, partial [Belnapia sp.]|nr:hypothetical protein [Belnapia sp.]
MLKVKLRGAPRGAPQPCLLPRPGLAAVPSALAA